MGHTRSVTEQSGYDRWMARIQDQQLGFWGEHWADRSDTEQASAWRDLAAERGASIDVVSLFHPDLGVGASMP
jgi:hypothetical protein